MIRPVSPRDFWSLRRKPYSRLYLYNEVMLARGHNPALYAVRCWLDVRGGSGVTLVYRDGGLRGFVQAWRRPGRPEIDLLYLAALPYGRKNPPPTDPDVWYRLLEQLIAYAGSKGIQRIYAPLASGAPTFELLRQLGFQPYTQRQVWVLRNPTVEEGSAMVALRAQARRDAFAIQQLYEAVAPRVVQQAEMRSSSSWHLPIPRVSWDRVRRKGWVLGREAGEGLDITIQAWIGPSNTVLYPLIRPDGRQKAEAALRYSLSQLPENRPVYALVSGYQSELQAPLEGLGFEHIGDQVLMVKNTVVALRSPRLSPVVEGGPDPSVIRAALRIHQSAEPAVPDLGEHARYSRTSHRLT